MWCCVIVVVTWFLFGFGLVCASRPFSLFSPFFVFLIASLIRAMSAYPTLTNPLLTSSPPNNRRHGGVGTNSAMLKGLSSASFRNFFSRSFHQLSQAGSQIRLPATKRIGPSISFNEHHYKDQHHIKKSSSNYQRSSSSTSSDPIIHYNGPCDTLDQLPDEKLEWIKHEPATAEALRHPLLDCPKSIVLRKPVTRSQTL